MTGPRTLTAPAAVLVEFGCERRCQAELDLDGIPSRHTAGQMNAAAEAAHKLAHEANPPEKVFRFSDNILVRADALDVVA
ncbi:hypothetical protein [Actinoplanes regularis]|uniref:Uncharacterized protein n=1 Tax=Actinoplanes regularis TaxID=52697 RepID=A0A238WRG9_9ACTN|nr:hypothetical protein [Actinoplanes regularis]GIE84583.1 hypothetical protein Are01nite_10630 [Actinoplanes regularis]SNR49067.1 hypothetical protein SAMN06264365_102829 [Actinoplanes regularis]